MDELELALATTYAPGVVVVAARLGRLADDVRARAAMLDRASASCRWDGVGAQAFRDRHATVTVRLTRVAHLLDDGASLVRGHAATVAAEVDRLRRPR